MEDCLPRKSAVILYADIARHSQLTGDDDINIRSGSSAAKQRGFIR